MYPGNKGFEIGCFIGLGVIKDQSMQVVYKKRVNRVENDRNYLE